LWLAAVVGVEVMEAVVVLAVLGQAPDSQ